MPHIHGLTVAYELAGCPRSRTPVRAHAYDPDPHVSRTVCGVVAWYAVKADRRWSEPQPVERCIACTALTRPARHPVSG
nr:hypothetical protein GCM10017745_80810 [Saccharothrix mutabilis subsp. capreolus]